MKPLSSSFHTLQTVLNCKFDCLIIACLKMQIWDIKISAPISTIKNVFTNEIQCPTNYLAIILRHNQKHFISHRPVKLFKYLVGEISPTPLSVTCRHVDSVKVINMVFRNRIASQ